MPRRSLCIEVKKKNQIKSNNIFKKAFSNFNRLIRWQFGLTIFQNGYQYVNFILPFAILAPQIIAGQLEVGTVTQSQAAFERIGFALGLIINQFDKVTAFSAGVSRLESLMLFTDSNELGGNSPENTITIQESSTLEVKNLTLKTPDNRTTLMKDLSLSIF